MDTIGFKEEFLKSILQLIQMKEIKLLIMKEKIIQTQMIISLILVNIIDLKML